MKRVIIRVLLALVALLLVAAPVLAYTYRVPYTINEDNGTAYTMLAVISDNDTNNDWMASNGFMNTSANDTTIETLGGAVKPHLVTDNMTLTAVPVPANSQTNLYFTTGNTPSATPFHIITGYGGYITTADNPSVIGGSDNWSIATLGYLDTAASSGKSIWYKKDAMDIYQSPIVTGNVTCDILGYDAGSSYPDIADTSEGSGTGATTLTITMPDDISSDDLLIIVLGTYNTSGATTLTEASGWVELFDTNYNSGANYFSHSVWYRIASGGESSSYNWTSTQTVSYSYGVVRIARKTYTGIPVAGTTATGAGSVPDSPSLTSGFGAVDTLWLSTYLSSNPQAAPPANYSWVSENGTTWYTTGITSRETQAASENPGAYPSSVAGWEANTVAIEGLGVVASVTASGLSANEHTFVWWSDTADLHVSVDSVEADNTTTSAIPSNTNNIVLFDGNVMPYADYITLSLDGVETIRYQPNTMIIGTALPDRDGTEDGVITWGSNPAGIAVTLGSMVAASQPTIGSTATEATSDLLPEVTVGDWYGDGTVAGAILTNPIRPFITMISDNTTLSELQVWRWMGLALWLFVTAVVGLKSRGHLGITAIISGVVIGGLVALDHNIYPLYLLILSIGMFIGGVVAERSPSL